MVPNPQTKRGWKGRHGVILRSYVRSLKLDKLKLGGAFSIGVFKREHLQTNTCSYNHIYIYHFIYIYILHVSIRSYMYILQLYMLYWFTMYFCSNDHQNPMIWWISSHIHSAVVTRWFHDCSSNVQYLCSVGFPAMVTRGYKKPLKNARDLRMATHPRKDSEWQLLLDAGGNDAFQVGRAALKGQTMTARSVRFTIETCPVWCIE